MILIEDTDTAPDVTIAPPREFSDKKKRSHKRKDSKNSSKKTSKRSHKKKEPNVPSSLSAAEVVSANLKSSTTEEPIVEPAQDLPPPEEPIIDLPSTEEPVVECSSAATKSNVDSPPKKIRRKAYIEEDLPLSSFQASKSGSRLQPEKINLFISFRKT